MNKFKLLMALGICGLVLGACGSDVEEGEVGEAVEQQDTTEEDTAEAVTETEDTSVDEPEEDENASREIVVGQPLELGDYTFTVQGYSLGTDYEGKDVLVVNYDWVNNSEENASPFMTFNLKGFQNNVETGDIFMVDGVDLESGQKEVRPEGIIEGAQTTVGIDDLNAPLDLELDLLMSFESNPYTTTLDLSSLQ